MSQAAPPGGEDLQLRRRPWISMYDEGLTESLEVKHRDALAMVESALELHPERDLIHYFGTTIRVRELDSMASALAVALADRGVGKGDRVALYMQNVPQFVIGLLAAWKLGGIGVSCSPMLRERELVRQLNDCEATCLIALESLYEDVAAGVLRGTGVTVAITTSDQDFVESPSRVLPDRDTASGAAALDLRSLIDEHAGSAPPRPGLESGDIALLTYTSGTTGPPKGAMNTHGNVSFASAVYQEWFHLDDRDVILGISPLFHITGLIAHIGLALGHPAPLVLSYRFDPVETCRLIEHHRATITVAAITAFLAILRSEAAARYDISSLTKAYSGGAAVPSAVVEEFEQRTGVLIRSAYGLTETTSPTHLTPLGRRTPTDEGSGALAVGVPVFDTGMRILDERGLPVAEGEVGEVALTGPQVVPGYWSRPEETAAAINEGELRTGDIGKADDEGWLYVIDRKKDLILTSGFNVWPREVEDALHEHPAVGETAVVGMPDAYRGEAVTAFVTVKPGCELDAAELEAFCVPRLAAYKRPRQVIFLESLPKTASGKVLRRQLRENPPAPTADPEQS